MPFLTSVAGLPTFIVAGTELIGTATGAIVRPYTSKYIPDIWLKRLFVVLAIYVGLRYPTQGFWGYSVVPPFQARLMITNPGGRP